MQVTRVVWTHTNPQGLLKEPFQYSSLREVNRQSLRGSFFQGTKLCGMTAWQPEAIRLYTEPVVVDDIVSLGKSMGLDVDNDDLGGVSRGLEK